MQSETPDDVSATVEATATTTGPFSVSLWHPLSVILVGSPYVRVPPEVARLVVVLVVLLLPDRLAQSPPRPSSRLSPAKMVLPALLPLALPPSSLGAPVWVAARQLPSPPRLLSPR